TEMGVDGFRMDAIKHVIESGQIQEGTPETIEWIRTFANWVREIKPDTFTVGEVMGSGTDGLQPYYPDTLDAYFHFQLAQEIVNGANFGNAVKITNFVKGAVERLPDQRWGTFLTNHDQERIASTLKGDMGKLGVAAMIMLSLPGIPFMYYGEEIGMQGTKPDPNIRTPMQWSTEAHGGFTTGIPFTPPQSDWETVNVELQSNDPSSLLNLYQTWGTARANHEAIRIGDYQALDTDQRSVMAFTRSTADESVLVVINMGKTESEPVHLSPGEGISMATSALDGTVIEVNGEVDLGIMPAQSGGIWVLS
ncbi:MAG: alpha-amylase family glycosyl hydrolase, partial [Thermomicrobiales bacterium]|nr:alpha-amylase family glycosyl hydrolase [Thermomicrobiales bacterium]